MFIPIGVWFSILVREAFLLIGQQLLRRLLTRVLSDNWVLSPKPISISISSSSPRLREHCTRGKGWEGCYEMPSCTHSMANVLMNYSTHGYFRVTWPTPFSPSHSNMDVEGAQEAPSLAEEILAANSYLRWGWGKSFCRQWCSHW